LKGKRGKASEKEEDKVREGWGWCHLAWQLLLDAKVGWGGGHPLS